MDTAIISASSTIVGNTYQTDDKTMAMQSGLDIQYRLQKRTLFSAELTH